MPNETVYILELDRTVLTLGNQRPPPDEPCYLKICVRQRLYDNNSVQESPSDVEVFPLSLEILLDDDLARNFVSQCLLGMGIPTAVQYPPIHAITSMFKGMRTSGSSNSRCGGEIPMVIADILVETWMSADEIEAASREREESMEIDMSKPVPATKTAIETLKKMRIENSGSTERCMICLEKFCDGLEVTRMPCCHIYHGDCIVKWLKTSHLCPLCRFPMSTDSCNNVNF